jgi:TonB family protein
MKSLTALFAVAVVMLAVSRSALASNVKVIANPSVKVDTISAADLRGVFLEERLSLEDGTHVEPVFAKRGPAHEVFLKLYLSMTDEALQTYYRSLAFTGKGSMPKALDSDTDVVAYVARTRGAIGYVSVEADTGGLKTLIVGDKGKRSGRVVLTRVEPEYPETLRLLHIGGSVRLAVTISAKGSVENIQILGGNPILAEAATEAVKKWIFTPGRSLTTNEISIPFDPR